MTAKRKKTPKLRPCMQATGSPALQIVLYRIAYWEPDQECDGKLWIAKPQDELGWETGLSPEQIQGALTKLRALGLIETRQHFQGLNVLHIHVTDACEAMLYGTAKSAPTPDPTFA